VDILGLGLGVSLASAWMTIGLLSLAAPILWLWMLIDGLLREEWEYPGATATSNNKLLWVLLMVFVQVSAIVYFFVVFSKIKRGTIAQPATVPVQQAA
jgi:hypothetical protein